MLNVFLDNMRMDKPKIAMAFKQDGQNGGPYVSHMRIMKSGLKDKYTFVPLYFPEGRIGLFKLKNLKKVREEIRRISPDIIQIPGLSLLGFHLMLAAVLEKKKTVLAVHGSSMEAIELSVFKRLVLKILEKYTLEKATRIYVVSDYVSTWESLRKYEKKCFGTIYNLPPEDIASSKDVRAELGIGKDEIVIVSTGRIIWEKGYEDLTQVIKENGVNESVRYLIVGEGNYLETMKEELREFEDRVLFLGYRKDVIDILRASDIFVILTLHETLCISIIEAGMQELPCIATNVGGIPEIIIDNENGILVGVHDIEKAKASLKKLVNDEKLRKYMGRKGRNYMTEVFSNNRIEHQLDELYRSLLDDK